MYAIANVIYGIPLTDKIYDFIHSEENVDAEELTDYGPDEEELGFTTPYHGGSNRTVGWLGVSLTEFDECSDFPLSDITNVKPTEEQIAEVKDKISKLPKEILDIALPTDIYVVWSTS